MSVKKECFARILTITVDLFLQINRKLDIHANSNDFRKEYLDLILKCWECYEKVAYSK